MKEKYSAKLIAKIALFTAISFLITFLEFPIFPAAPFLKLDFSNVLVLIGGFALGPWCGIVILVVKTLLCLLLKGFNYVGELANLIIGLGFILPPLIIYTKDKTFKRAMLGMCIGCVAQIVLALFSNAYILYPFYGLNFEAFKNTFVFIILFNLIKGVSVCLITSLLYKKVRRIFS